MCKYSVPLYEICQVAANTTNKTDLRGTSYFFISVHWYKNESCLFRQSGFYSQVKPWTKDFYHIKPVFSLRLRWEVSIHVLTFCMWICVVLWLSPLFMFIPSQKWFTSTINAHTGCDVEESCTHAAQILFACWTPPPTHISPWASQRGFLKNF